MSKQKDLEGGVLGQQFNYCLLDVFELGTEKEMLFYLLNLVERVILISIWIFGTWSGNVLS